MSKHQKEVRRERRKVDRARRRRRLPAVTHGAAALAAAAVIAAGTQAYADPLRYDNPAGGEHFEWPTIPGDGTHWLDLTLAAGDQPGVINSPTAVRQLIGGGGTTSLRGGDGPVEVQTVYLTYGNYAVGVDAGTLIPSGFDWNRDSYIYYPGYAYALPPNDPTYLGVRWDLGGGTQYGWIGVVLNPADHQLDAFAWGYETEPGVPIPAGIPEPGSLALLAFGALAVAGRRRA